MPADDKNDANGFSALQSDGESEEPARSKAKASTEPLALVDELGIEDSIRQTFRRARRRFSAAGRDAPIAEFSDDGLMLRPAQKPFTDEPPGEVIVHVSDQRGVLLNELGEPRRILGARFNGRPLYTMAELRPDTDKHLVAWFDKNNYAHKLNYHGEPLTSDMAFRIRNSTLDGELSVVPDLTTD